MALRAAESEHSRRDRAERDNGNDKPFVLPGGADHTRLFVMALITQRWISPSQWSAPIKGASRTPVGVMLFADRPIASPNWRSVSDQHAGERFGDGGGVVTITGLHRDLDLHLPERHGQALPMVIDLNHVAP